VFSDPAFPLHLRDEENMDRNSKPAVLAAFHIYIAIVISASLLNQIHIKF
jgi:hypothetical protein